MPWEKSFDIDEAIDRATEVFWAKGYEAASLADLLKATGINKGSFYNAFGSKKKLFTLGLQKYKREQHKATLYRLSQMQDAVSAITALFDLIIAQSREDEEKKGCLFVNTALDLPNLDSNTAETVSSALADIEAFFKEQIIRGQKSGDIPKTVDPAVASKGLMTLVVGLRVLSRGVSSSDELEVIKAQAVDLIT
ncbi:MAG: TetR/AcrR family transcriptional regulator [Proteobacteria bacterium]|nr:TetR/AcrR family transcriptional regulator [Pseudomonadota bacterium]